MTRAARATTVHPSVQSRRSEIAELCRRYRVRRLEIFGSGARCDGNGEVGDLDFLVEFKDRATGDYADAYFGLLEDLESLFALPIDLVIMSAVDNPYFLEDIARSRVVLWSVPVPTLRSEVDALSAESVGSAP